MNILFLFLLPCSMSYGNAAENSSKEQIAHSALEASREVPLFRVRRARRNDIGTETIQDPNDPKYKEMAEEIAYKHLKYKKDEVKDIELSEVMTQITEIKYINVFLVAMNNGKLLNCSSEILQQFEFQSKHVSYQCEEIKDPTLPYYPIAQKAAEDFVNNLQETHKIIDVKVVALPIMELRVSKKQILYFNIDVLVRHYGDVESTERCTVVFNMPDDMTPLSVNCFDDPIEHFKGADVWMNPNATKYKELADKALSNNTNVINDAKSYDIIVTFVIYKVSWGRNKLDFIVRVEGGPSYECHATVWEKLSEDLVEKCKCNEHKHVPKKLAIHRVHRVKKSRSRGKHH